MPKTFNAFIIAAAIIKDRGRILLLEEDRLGQRMLNPPGGRMNPNETPMETAVREVREETGIEVRLNSLIAIIQGTWPDGGLFAKFVFEGEKIRGEEHAEKTTTIHWLTPEQIITPARRPAPILGVDEEMLIEYLMHRETIKPFFYRYSGNAFKRDVL